MQPQFKIGLYRPIYLWAGDGTVRMNRLKFMNVAVDEAVHAEAHQERGAKRVLEDMHCNWVHLMYDWGFPPEVEAADWEAFRQAAEVYHQAGSPVFAYIQTSNCVYDGSFRQKDWYARDENGRKITYFTYAGRYMACLASPDWKEHLLELVRGALERGADGIFFDNLFQGTSPMGLFGAWLGGVGCHCPRCQAAYRGETGAEIPGRVRRDDPNTARYLRWRAGQVTGLMADLADEIRSLKADAPVSANDFDPILRNSYLAYGIDLEALAGVQDVTMIENFGLPRWDALPRPRLANNALSVRTARRLVAGGREGQTGSKRKRAHLNVLSYDVGIGFDPVYPPRRYQQGIAEAAALGVSMTTKGTEYHDGTKMTLLTDPQYAEVHAALGHYHAWLEAYADLYEDGRRNLAKVGLLFPGEELWLDWMRLARPYFWAGQALTVEGYPWRVVYPGDDLAGLQVLLTFAAGDVNQTEIGAPANGSGLEEQGPRVVQVERLAGWNMKPESWVEKNDLLNDVAAAGAKSLLGMYGSVKLMRHLMDGIGMQKIVTQSPLYFVPTAAAREALVQACCDSGEGLYPRARAEQPVLLEVWQDENPGRPATGVALHLVNYNAAPQSVQVEFGSPVSWRSVSPEGKEQSGQGAVANVAVDIYQVLFVEGLAC